MIVTRGMKSWTRAIQGTKCTWVKMPFILEPCSQFPKTLFTHAFDYVSTLSPFFLLGRNCWIWINCWFSIQWEHGPYMSTLYLWHMTYCSFLVVYHWYISRLSLPELDLDIEFPVFLYELCLHVSFHSLHFKLHWSSDTVHWPHF